MFTDSSRPLDSLPLGIGLPCLLVLGASLQSREPDFHKHKEHR
jgi:hypothetical protein